MVNNSPSSFATVLINGELMMVGSAGSRFELEATNRDSCGSVFHVVLRAFSPTAARVRLTVPSTGFCLTASTVVVSSSSSSDTSSSDPSLSNHHQASAGPCASGTFFVSTGADEEEESSSSSFRFEVNVEWVESPLSSYETQWVNETITECRKTASSNAANSTTSTMNSNSKIMIRMKKKRKSSSGISFLDEDDDDDLLLFKKKKSGNSKKTITDLLLSSDDCSLNKKSNPAEVTSTPPTSSSATATTLNGVETIQIEERDASSRKALLLRNCSNWHQYTRFDSPTTTTTLSCFVAKQAFVCLVRLAQSTAEGANNHSSNKKYWLTTAAVNNHPFDEEKDVNSSSDDEEDEDALKKLLIATQENCNVDDDDEEEQLEGKMAIVMKKLQILNKLLQKQNRRVCRRKTGVGALFSAACSKNREWRSVGGSITFSSVIRFIQKGAGKDLFEWEKM